MEPQTPNGTLKASADFKEFKPNRVEPSLGQLGLFEGVAAKESKELITECMKLEPQGIGAKAVAGKPLPLKIALKFLDPVLTLSAIVVPVKDLLGCARTVGDNESHVSSQRRDFNLNQDAALFSPAFSSMPKAIEASDGDLTARILVHGAFKPALGFLLKDRVSGNAHRVKDLERFQSLIDLWCSGARIGPIAELSFGKTTPKKGNNAAKLVWDSL